MSFLSDSRRYIRTRVIEAALAAALFMVSSSTAVFAEGVFESEFINRFLIPLRADQPFVVDELHPFPMDENGAQRFRNVQESFTALTHQTPDFRLAAVSGFLRKHDYDRALDHFYWIIADETEVELAASAFDKLRKDRTTYSEAPNCLQPLPQDLPIVREMFRGAISFESEAGTPGVFQLLIVEFQEGTSNSDERTSIALLSFAGTSRNIPCLN